MKKLALLMSVPLIAILFIGYYSSIEDAEIHTHFFIKKRPTFQIEFFNIYANDGDPKKLTQLRPDEREKVIAYCMYRLGIKTALDTQEALEACQKR